MASNRTHADRADFYVKSELERELEGDLEHLNDRARCLIDMTAIVQGDIRVLKYRLRRLREIGDYPLPDE